MHFYILETLSHLLQNACGKFWSSECGHTAFALVLRRSGQGVPVIHTSVRFGEPYWGRIFLKGNNYR